MNLLWWRELMCYLTIPIAIVEPRHIGAKVALACMCFSYGAFIHATRAEQPNEGKVKAIR